jgi:OmpA-OmpF porin, OOP family
VPGSRAVVVALACALSLPAAAEPGWYGFGSFGRSSFDDGGTQSALAGGDDKDNGARIGAGYMFSERLGIEAGWMDFGKAKRGGAIPGLSATRDGDVRANGPFLAGVASLPLTGRLSAFGKVGLIDARIGPSPDADAGIAGFFENTGDLRPMVGVGGTWRLTRDWALQTEYGQFSKLVDGVNAIKVSTLSVGMRFRLG